MLSTHKPGSRVGQITRSFGRCALGRARHPKYSFALRRSGVAPNGSIMTPLLAPGIAWLSHARDILFCTWAALHLALVPLFDRPAVRRKTGHAWFCYVIHPLAPLDLYCGAARPLWAIRRVCACAFVVAALARAVLAIVSRLA